MRKLVFVFCAFAALAMASCGNGTSDNNVVNDSDTVTVDSTNVGTVVCDSTCVDCDCCVVCE